MAIWGPLVAQYGIPAAIQIYRIIAERFGEKDALTEEMIVKLQAVENERHARLVAALAKPV